MARSRELAAQALAQARSRRSSTIAGHPSSDVDYEQQLEQWAMQMQPAKVGSGRLTEQPWVVQRT
jgi:hypothetical protein